MFNILTVTVTQEQEVVARVQINDTVCTMTFDSASDFEKFQNTDSKQLEKTVSCI